MLDINFIRQNLTKVKEACQNKNLSPQVVDQLLTVDQDKKKLIQQTDLIRKQINDHARKIKEAVTAGKKLTKDLIDKGKELKKSLKKIDPQLKELEIKYYQLMLEIPNIPAAEVPVGADESGNKVVRQEGKKPVFSFKAKTHYELMEKLDLLDMQRAVKIAGTRAYFLKNDAVLLEQAILNYALQLMIKHGFTPMTAPALVNQEAMIGTGYFPWGKEDHYFTQEVKGKSGEVQTSRILAGTAEVALTAYRQGELLREKDLPIKMTGISPCFRREIGSYGKDTKGVFRLHQFNKVEQVVYTVANEQETQQWHEKMLGFAEQLLKDLVLPYQVLLMCTGDMGAGQRKKYDIETWFPGQEKYRETHSCSYFNDFQSRRLNIRYQAKDGTIKYVYTINNTVAATPRLLAAIVENYQLEDGSIQVPMVLQKAIGKKIIKYA